MSFLILFLAGIAGGVFGGMGMGGGTVLIPLLTLGCGIAQKEAQAINLAAFLPMSAAALAVHARDGLLEKRGLLSLALPALAVSGLCSLGASFLPAAALRRAFGLFLLVLSVFQIHIFSEKRHRGRVFGKKFL